MLERLSRTVGTENNKHRRVKASMHEEEYFNSHNDEETVHSCISFAHRLCIYRTAIGIRVKDGVVLAVEKLIQSKLLVPGANRRIQNVDRHVGIVRRAGISVLGMVPRILLPN